MFGTSGVHFIRVYFYLTNIGMMNFCDYGDIDVARTSFLFEFGCDVQLKQTVAICLFLALHLYDLSRAPLICTPLCQE